MFRDKDGDEAGPKDGIFTPAPHGFVLSYSCLASYDRKIFFAPSLPLGAPQNPAPPRKTLLFVNLFTTITIVFNKTCFVNKDRKSTRLNSSHSCPSRMPSSA